MLNEIWINLTAAQATLIAGICTIAAAFIGVLFGCWLFNGRVSDLKSAIEKSDKIIKDHKDLVESSLSETRKKVTELVGQIAIATAELGKIRGSVSDLQSASDKPTSLAEENSIEQIRNDWNIIRDKLEQIAADAKVDGRSRAKYARIDRRNYLDLVNVIAQDNRLGGNADLYRKAAAIWQKYKNGRSGVDNNDADKLKEIANFIQKDNE
jgi:vacuolar-type H+-ATPase subunit I/STV1